MVNIFLSGVFLIFISGIISLFVKEKFKGFIVSFFVLCGIILTLIPSFSVIIRQEVITESIILNFPVGELKIVIDPLASFFIIFTSIMSFIGTIYSIGYLNPYLNTKRAITSHYFFLNVLISSMILVLSIQNALAFLIIWEVMSISSFFLVIFENEKTEVFEAGINYLITMHVGVVFLIIGFILLSLFSGGSFDFESFKIYLNQNKDKANIIFIILFIGFGIKAGFIPFHTWLPKAHPASPTNISGMMSGIMIKIGIYGILRVLTFIGNPGYMLGYFVLSVSLVSGVLGVMYAITQHDYKRLLAYHSVENIGIIGIGIGLGMLGVAYNNNFMSVLGFSGALLHVLNHSIFKMLLFYSSGAVYQKTHTRNIDDLGGLIKKMKFTSIFFLIGALSITGVPPFNGFISEFLIYSSMINGISSNNLLASVFIILSVAFLAFIGCMALLCFTKVFGILFLGNPRTEKVLKAEEVGLSMIIPMALLSLFCILIGLFPYTIMFFIKPVLSVFGIESTFVFSNVVSLLGNISKYLFVFILIFICIFFIRFLLLRKKRVFHFKTWDCGYQAYNPRMQYTSSSFSKSFLTLINPLIIKEYDIIKPEGFFPQHASFESKSHDIIENRIIKPGLKLLNKFLRLFTWIQSGSTQKYIMYGLFFLIIIILVIIGLEMF